MAIDDLCGFYFTHIKNSVLKNQDEANIFAVPPEFASAARKIRRVRALYAATLPDEFARA
jgi:hypothetical protein